MNYLQDRRSKKRKFYIIASIVFVFLIVVFFQASIFSGLSSVAHAIFRPVIVVGNKIGGSFGNLGYYFMDKKWLGQENAELKKELEEKESELSNHKTILDENVKLKETLSRLADNSYILSAILSKYPKSPFDTLLLDVGAEQGVAAGANVYAKGGVPIGKISELGNNTSIASLFSTPGQKTEVILSGSDIYLEAVGRGGGNFEINIPRDFIINEGDEAVLPGIAPKTVAVFVKIISDPRDSFAKALFVSPVNIAELKFVEIKK
jgi:cell shape-determining protein MreC